MALPKIRRTGTKLGQQAQKGSTAPAPSLAASAAAPDPTADYRTGIRSTEGQTATGGLQTKERRMAPSPYGHQLANLFALLSQSRSGPQGALPYGGDVGNGTQPAPAQSRLGAMNPQGWGRMAMFTQGMDQRLRKLYDMQRASQPRDYSIYYQ